MPILALKPGWTQTYIYAPAVGKSILPERFIDPDRIRRMKYF